LRRAPVPPEEIPTWNEKPQFEDAQSDRQREPGIEPVSHSHEEVAEHSFLNADSVHRDRNPLHDERRRNDHHERHETDLDVQRAAHHEMQKNDQHHLEDREEKVEHQDGMA